MPTHAALAEMDSRKLVQVLPKGAETACQAGYSEPFATITVIASIPRERPPAPVEEQLERIRSLAIRLQQECTTALNELRADESGVVTH